MKTLPFLFSSFLLLGLFNGLLSSNPDSIAVQGSEDNEAKSAQVRKETSAEERQPQATENSEGGSSDGLFVSVIRRVPNGPGSRVVYKEIAREDFERIMQLNGFPPYWQGFAANQPHSRRQPPTESQTGNSGRYFFTYRPRGSQNRFRGNGNTNYDQEISKVFGVSVVTSKSEEVDDSGVTIGPNNYRGTKNNAKENNNNGNEDSKTFSISSDTSKTEDTNNRGTNGDNSHQISPNNAKGNNNNNNNNNNARGPSRPVDLDNNNNNARGPSKPVDLDNNNNNARGPSKPVDLAPTPPEDDEVFFEDDIRGYPATKPVKRISQNLNFFSGIVNDFAFKLMETQNLESSFVISPLSIYVALAMCYLGSDGRTKEQLEQALGMNENDVHEERLHRGIKDLILSVRAETPGYQLFLANGMLLGKNFTVDNKFNEYIRRYYNAEVLNLDFENPELSLQFVNRWVAENTRNMITSILNSPPPPVTRLLLLNAIFFKGIWEMQFPIHLTRNGKFYTSNGTENEVEFMNLYGETFPFYRSEVQRHNFIKLPYENNEVSMIIALPFTARDKPLPRIRDRDLCAVRDAMVNTKLGKVSIPKFRLEYRNSLRKALLDLGVTDIFNRNEVDLRNMRIKNDVYATGIIHKAVIDIDEVGTMASAITDVVYEPLIRSASFEANHPFAFYVIHEPTGLVLFYGKIFNFESDANIADGRRQNIPMRQRPNSQNRG